MVSVYLSRHDCTLRPGDGEKIAWRVGEVVSITEGPDYGRLFEITSERRSHDDAPGRYVREGFFVDDPARTVWAKMERQFWFHSAR